jgi:hypothetical protein
MERITSHQVLGLMEAYTAVHTPQINEEQVWEEVESWVNSLLEEGYDLSEYTWEEMYEEYITEIGVNFGGQKAVNAVQARSAQQQQSNAKLDAQRTQRFGGSRPSGATTKSQLVGSTPTTAKPAPAQGQKYKSSSDGKTYANYNDALAAKNSRMGALGVQQGLQRTFNAGGGNAAVAQGKSPSAVMAQGSTNLQRPATPAPTAARPATPAPTAAPARNGFGVSARPIAAQSSVSSVTAPASAPASRPSLATQSAELRAMQAASRQRQGLTQSFDPFDVVLGHLIDEGYADTEEAALVIMANMSEEWREGILDEGKSDRPLGLMHSFSRGMKQKKGEKSEVKHGQDSEGNLTGKYSDMQNRKRADKKDKENTAYNDRQRVETRGTWDKP